MVSKCPSDTRQSLAEKCLKDVPAENYSYLMDMPVVSESTDLIYSNIFCAKCNKDMPLRKYDRSIMCNCKLDSKVKLREMDYQVGTRTWTTNNLHNATCDPGVEKITCVLAVTYPIDLGRVCEDGLVNTCAADWQNDEEISKCSSYNYYVSNSQLTVFKNPDCAICNYVPEDQIRCLTEFITLRFGQRDSGMFHLSDLFSTNEDSCSENQILDFVFDECKRIEDEETGSSGAASSIIYIILMSISLIAMILHMGIYFILFKKRNLHTTNLFSMVFSLFWAELLLLICSQECNSVTGCYISTVLVYYLFMNAFFWMNVMSYDICKTFHSTSIRDNSLRKYRKFALYAYGVPLILATIAVIVDLAAPDIDISPGFGDNGFWFANRGGLLLFFVGPTELLFLCNMAMLVVSIYNIYQHQKHSRFARINHKKNKKDTKKEKELKAESVDLMASQNEVGNEDPSKLDKFQEKLKSGISKITIDKERLILYTKLALIVGVPWFFAFFDHLSVVFDYIFNILNSLQGLLIFIAFDCKAKIWIDVCERLGFDNLAKSLATATGTQESGISSTGTGRATLVTTSSGTGVARGSTTSKSPMIARTHGTIV